MSSHKSSKPFKSKLPKFTFLRRPKSAVTQCSSKKDKDLANLAEKSTSNHNTDAKNEAQSSIKLFHKEVIASRTDDKM